MFELKYQSAFGKIILYRIYGNDNNYNMMKKASIDSNSDKIEKVDSLNYKVDNIKIAKFKSELERYSFWDTLKYESKTPCLDGFKIKVSGAKYVALSQIESTNCTREI